MNQNCCFCLGLILISAFIKQKVYFVDRASPGRELGRHRRWAWLSELSLDTLARTAAVWHWWVKQKETQPRLTPTRAKHTWPQGWRATRSSCTPASRHTTSSPSSSSRGSSSPGCPRRSATMDCTTEVDPPGPLCAGTSRQH